LLLVSFKAYINNYSKELWCSAEYDGCYMWRPVYTVPQSVYMQMHYGPRKNPWGKLLQWFLFIHRQCIHN